MTGPDDERGRALYDEGSQILASLWDEDAGMVRLREAPAFHDPRGTLDYAHVLLGVGDIDGAQRAIRSVLEMQEARPQDAHFGNFRWLLEDACVTDLNGVEFVLDGLIPLARDHTAALGDELAAEVRAAIALGLAEIDKLDVHLSYTNIALSDIANTVLGGELLGDARYVERGARRLDEWIAFTNASGAPHEFNSPTYVAVDILRLAAVAEHARDRRIALKARIAEERLWLHVAAHYHPGLAQIAGAHSREYFDGWSGAGGLVKLMLWRLLGDGALRRDTPYAARSREEGQVDVAMAEMHCPESVERRLREKQYPHVAAETTDAARGLDITTYMDEGYAIGTASRSWGVGEPPEPWPQFGSMQVYLRRSAAPGYGAMYSRYVIDDLAPGAPGFKGEDHPDAGRHVAAQHRNMAIVAYGLVPRLRAMHSCKHSVRLLGFGGGDEAWIGERRVEAWPAGVEPEQRVVIATGDVYIMLAPLRPTDMGSDAPIELNLDGGVLTLDIYNYKGPPKSFWEHRSQAGPFYRENVRNACVVEVAGRDAFADAAAYRRRAAGMRVSDTVDAAHRRTIECASPDGSLALTYDLRDMRLVERRSDGAVYEPPMSRVGAIDGRGPQFVVARGGTIELGRVTVDAGSAPAWLTADDDARRYVFVQPSAAPVAVSLRTPDTLVECDSFGFGRIDLDEAAGVVRVDAIEERPAVRVAGAGVVRLIVNGVDVTGETP
jgi:hypothetical protein